MRDKLPSDFDTEERIDLETLGEAAVNKIRRSILDGSLGPGEKLDQARLAERYGISRMPVRDALRQLEHDGLVRIDPRRGASVVALNMQELNQIYEIRETLEALAARKAGPLATDEDVERVAGLAEEMREAARVGDTARFLELDHDFHLTAYRACANSRLLKAIGELANATWIYRIALLHQPGCLETTERGHEAIANALRARDSKLFERLIRRHLRETVRFVGDSADLSTPKSRRSPPTRPPELNDSRVSSAS